MKVGLHLLAILAFGAVSTQVAVAGHPGHHANSSAAASHSGTNPQNLTKTPPAPGNQQGAGPAVQGGIADHANGGAAKDGSVLTGTDKAVADDVGAHPRESAKTGVSSNTAPAAALGLHRAPTPAPGDGGKQGDAGVPIDTRITAHQGHEAIRGNKERAIKKPKATIIPGIALKHEPVHNLRQASPVGSNGSPPRNAIGAAVEHDKTVEHGIGAADAVITPPTDVARQRVGATLHDYNAKAAIGNASIKNTSTGATENSNHLSAAADALKIVTANGPIISGTGMIRPGSGVGAVGGPTRIAAGRISGSSFRPKHL